MGFKTKIKMTIEFECGGKQSGDARAVFDKFFRTKKAKILNATDMTFEVDKTESVVDEGTRALNMLKRIAKEILGPEIQLRGTTGYISPTVWPKDGNRAIFSWIKLQPSEERLEVATKNDRVKFRLADPELFNQVRKFLGLEK